MSMLVDIFASSGLGAIVGLVGSWVTKREERKNTEMKYQNDQEMAKHAATELTAENEHELAMVDANIERAQVEGGIAIGSAEMKAFKEGLKEQRMKYGGFVDSVRGMMRPAITIYLLILATFVTWQIGKFTGGLEALDQTVMSALYADTIGQIFFLVTTSVTWWFGSRPAGVRK